MSQANPPYLKINIYLPCRENKSADSTHALILILSWVNLSILEHLRVKSEKIKELYTFTGTPIFEASIVKVNEQQAWELSAMAVEFLKFLGCYSIPFEGRQLRSFLSVDKIITCPKDLRLN